MAGKIPNLGRRRTVDQFLKLGRNISVDQFLNEIDPRNVMMRTTETSKSDHDLVPEHMRASRAYQLHTNACWQKFMNAIIVLNAIQIGVAAETTGNTVDDAWKACDYIFTTIFTIEMIVALLALRLHYFSSPWNWLDFVVVNTAIIDTCVLPLVKSEAGRGSWLSTFRAFRLLKLLRLAKMLKVIPQLMVVVEGLLASIKAMIWVFMLLVLLLYTMGIVCKEIIGDSGAGYPAFSEQTIEEKVVAKFNNYLYFGSIARSMTTLFNMVILAEWPEVLRPVAEHQPAMVVFFVFIVFLCSFGVLNVMIGIVVENTTMAMQQEREDEQLQHQASQIKLAEQLADMVFHLDVNGDEMISKAEIENPQEAEIIQKIVGGLGLPLGYSLDELFLMLDVDGNGALSKLEFVQGIMRLIHCDQFQRDCLFSTGIGHLRQAVTRGQEQLRQSFEQQLQETCIHVTSLFKQLHQGPGESHQGSIDMEDVVLDKLKHASLAKHADFPLLEHSPESTADSARMAYVRVVEAEELNLSGLWNELISAEVLCVEAAEVPFLGEPSGTRTSLVGSDTEKAKDVEHVDRGASAMMGALGQRRKVKWDALQKSLLLVHKTDGYAFDAKAAEEMECMSDSHELVGWMPVIKKIPLKQIHFL